MSLQSDIRAATLPEMTVPLTCGVNLKAYNVSSENLDQVQSMGTKIVRRGFIWPNVEKSAGTYDFSEYDKLFQDCEARGLSILGCIALNNGVHPHVKEPAGRKAFANYAAALAARYKGRKVYWEIWNEPNIASFWGKHGKANTEQYAQEYTDLVKEVIPAMRKADPDCFVMAGSVSGLWKDSYAWMDHCFKKGILKSGISGWSVHPYTLKCPEDYIEGYTKLRQMIATGGAKKDFPVIDSERGYPTGKAEGYAGGDPALSLEYQAWHFVRQYMVDLLCDIRITIWYEWSGTEGFSLIVNNQPTPAFDAAKFMTGHLAGYRLDGRVPLSSERDFVLRFKNEAGNLKYVAWTAPPSGGTADLAITHDVEIPVQASGRLDLFDLYGTKGSVEAAEGKIKIKLKPAPQYIDVK